MIITVVQNIFDEKHNYRNNSTGKTPHKQNNIYDSIYKKINL